MYDMISTNFKKLTLKYSYLVLEEEEVKDIIYSADKEIRKYVKENHPERFKALYENFQKKQEENKKNETLTQTLIIFDETDFSSCKGPPSATSLTGV